VSSVSPNPAQQVTEYLLAEGHVKASDIDQARHLADETAESLGLIMTRTGLVADTVLAGAYAKVLEQPLLTSDEIPIDPPGGLSVRESFLRDSHILPLTNSGEALEVATADPENGFALDALRMAANKPLRLRIATITQVDKALDRWFEKNGPQSGANGEEALIPADSAESIDRLRDLASQAPVIRYVNSTLRRAMEARASDIHIEPFEKRMRVRFRIDGSLRCMDNAPPHLADAIVSRIKLMANMDISERRLPQDGRVQIRIQGNSVDLRVSTIPTIRGESIVLRLLDQSGAGLDLDSLGFQPSVRRQLESLMCVANGILLVTGPTGSGKTTTLYTLLKQVNTSEKKVITIEDPVEYRLEGINQIQVKPQIGLDFSQALRSILRQDPDVIMVGEMRDLETARIAIQSALTGHLVLSTLHTNDAGSTVTRLLDMGIEDYLITSSVNAILSQRLVRALCSSCREAREPPASLIGELGLARDTGTDGPLLYHPTGCPACDFTGFRGRTVISELLPMDDEARSTILSGADGKSIQRRAGECGMTTLYSDGLTKVAAGETTIEEICRVTQS
jgi:general secretion pathway protein E